MKHHQLVLVEFINCNPYVTNFVSNFPIDTERVAAYLTRTDLFNPNVDSITFLDDPTETDLDN